MPRYPRLGRWRPPLPRSRPHAPAWGRRVRDAPRPAWRGSRRAARSDAERPAYPVPTPSIGTRWEVRSPAFRRSCLRGGSVGGRNRLKAGLQTMGRSPRRTRGGRSGKQPEAEVLSLRLDQPVIGTPAGSGLPWQRRCVLDLVGRANLHAESSIEASGCESSLGRAGGSTPITVTACSFVPYGHGGWAGGRHSPIVCQPLPL